MELGNLLPQSPTEWGALLVAYLLGSLPCGLLLGLAKGVDIRQAGSRSIGATNAGRVLGRPFALIAFVGDFSKGCFPAYWLGPAFAEPGHASIMAVLCGAAAVVGHVWPIYLRFRGGKAVATGCGAIVGIDPVIFVVGGLVWLAAVGLLRFVGLASILMVCTFPVVAWIRRDVVGGGIEVVIGTSLLALLVLWRHRANISRMMAGTEPRVGQSKKTEESS